MKFNSRFILNATCRQVYLFLAYSQANQTNALYGLSTQQPELLLNSILHYVFQWWHEQVVVWHKLLLCRVSHWGDGCHHLLQDEFGALLDQLQRKKYAGNEGQCCRMYSNAMEWIYLLKLGFHDDVKILYQVIQIRDQQRLGTVLREVDESSSSMCLHPRVTLVLHRFKQSWNHLKWSGGAYQNM